MTGIDGYDWSALGGKNPVPGDPDAVRAMAEKFSGLASTVRVQNRLLRATTGEVTSVRKGPAAEAFAAKLAPLRGELDELVASYDDAASALGAYWPKLREAQDQALQALARPRAASEAIAAAQVQLTAQDAQVVAAAARFNRLAGQSALVGAASSAAGVYSQQASQSQAQAAYQAARAQAASTQTELSAAQHSLSDAQAQCVQAVAMAQAAASACGSELDAASKAGIHNPHRSLWGGVVSGVEDVALGAAALFPTAGGRASLRSGRGLLLRGRSHCGDAGQPASAANAPDRG